MADMTTTVAQRARTKGWRKPEGSVCVDRTSRWGNPFGVQSCIDNGFADSPEHAREVCAHYFRLWLAGRSDGYVHGQDERRQWILDHVHELAGKTLLCWCPQPGPCHAHVLAEMADAKSEELDP